MTEPPAKQEMTVPRYLAILDAAKDAGYRFSSFATDDGREGNLLLRHDIDKSVPMALRMAALEKRAGIRATYFFLLRSPLYSLLEPETVEMIREIRHLGHDIGLHCDTRRMRRVHQETADDEAVMREIRLMESALDFEIAPIVSFHNPEPKWLAHVPSEGTYLSTYDPRFMLPKTKYISDSAGRWREGDPLERIRMRTWPRLQILVHPVYWSAEEPQPPLERLVAARDERVRTIEDYLSWSNDLWREHETTVRLTQREEAREAH